MISITLLLAVTLCLHRAYSFLHSNGLELRNRLSIARSSKGFGVPVVPPPQDKKAEYKEVPADDSPCTCGSEATFSQCCKKILHGFNTIDSEHTTPAQLARARFSAYTHGYSDFIIHTTHPLNRVKFSSKLHLNIVTFILSQHYTKWENKLDPKKAFSVRSEHFIFRPNLHLNLQRVGQMKLMMVAVTVSNSNP